MDGVKTIIIIEVVILVVVVAMVVLLIMVVHMVIKEILKRNFINRSGTTMRKRKKKGVKIMAKKLKIYVIIVAVMDWTRACYTPKHLVELYQESLKKKNIETHFAYEDGDSDYGHMDTTHLDIGDFFSKPDGSIDHLIGDGSVRK